MMRFLKNSNNKGDTSTINKYKKSSRFLIVNCTQISGTIVLFQFLSFISRRNACSRCEPVAAPLV